MASVSQLLVGNRVYRGTSHAPNIGTSDPSGYITRGITQARKKMAGFGLAPANPLAQRRSGLAATALNQLRQRPLTPTVHHPAGTAPVPAGRPTPALPTVTTNGSSTLSTSPTGRISLVTDPTPSAGTTDPNSPSNVLPTYYQDSASRNALLQAHDNTLNQLNVLRQQLAEKTTNSERALDQSAPQLALNLLNKYAGRGMARSSGYGYGVGQQQQNLAQQHAALQQQLNEGMANYAAQQQNAEDTYNTGLANLNAAAANSLAGKAGSLFLNGSPITLADLQALASGASKVR